MAPKAKDTKRPRLTLAQLASYDDICTDALVDQVFFWSKIRKNRSKYNSGRGFSEEGVAKILFDEIVCNKDTATAEHKLLGIPALKKFVERLNTGREVDDFKKHLRKYINMWLPDCPFEVTTTNRYTIVTQEAAVHARRDISKGETIRYLTGNLVSITDEEEKDLDLTRRDFSIVMSSRKKTPSLFLGPARFANHDCNANARLTTIGSDGMQIVAVRQICQDEEITVTYGEDYFGPENCECLCRSCENDIRGGWSTTPNSVSQVDTPIPTIEDAPEPYKLRHKRKYVVDTTATPDPETFRPAKKRRSNTVESPRSSPSSPRPDTRSRRKTNLRSVLSRWSPENTDNAVADVPLPSVESSPAPMVALPYTELKDAIATPTLGQGMKQPSVALETDVCIKQGSQPVDPSFEINTEKGLRLAHLKTPTKTLRLSQASAASASTDVDSVFEIDEVDLIPTGTPSSVQSDSQNPITGRSNIKKSMSSQALSAPAMSQLSTTRPSENKRESLLASEYEGAPPVVPIAMEATARPDVVEELSPDSNVSVPAASASEALVQEHVEKQQHHPLPVTPDTVIKEEPQESPPITEAVQDPNNSDLSDLPSDEEFDDFNVCIVKKQKRRPGRKRKLAPPKSTGVVEPETPQVRYPNDYTNTPLLLAEPESKWVQCRTCCRVWVQQNAYYTKRECPRCERHSKLYGYRWPKTEQLKGDPERIMDHREVHRFLDAEEELELKQKERLLARLASEAIE